MLDRKAAMKRRGGRHGDPYSLSDEDFDAHLEEEDEDEAKRHRLKKSGKRFHRGRPDGRAEFEASQEEDLT